MRDPRNAFTTSGPNAFTASGPNAASNVPGPEAASPARSRVGGLIPVVAAAVLAAVGGLAFTPLADVRALAVVPFAAVIPALLALAVRRWTLPVAVAGWFAAGVPLALAFGTGPASVPDTIRGGLVDGFRTALTSALPLPATPAVLFWIFTLVWWAAYWATRAARVGGTPGLVLLPPGLVLLTGTAFGIAAPGRGLPAAPLFAGTAVVVLAARGCTAPRRAPARDGTAPPRGAVGSGAAARRGAATAVTSVIVVCGAVVAAGRLPYAGERPAFDPRALVHQPVRTERQISPLALAALWAAEPPRPLFRVDTGTPVNQRLAVFDGYDGRDWSSSASYTRAGTRLPDGAPVSGRTLRETVTVGGLELAWLPAPDRPVGVTGALVGVDRATGVLVTADGRSADGLRYTVTSRTPSLSVARAAGAAPASGPDLAADLRVPPDVPLSIVRDADRLSPPGAAPYQRLLALQEHLRSRYRYDVRAAPGRTAGHLHFFYDKSHRGTADQFATVFALMARHLGIPARIAVGFAPGHATGPDRYEVTTGDVVVWPEVALRGLGWVPFYPLPRPSAGAATVGRSVGESPERAALDRAVAAAPARHLAPTGTARPSPAGKTGSPGRTAGYAWAVTAVLVVIGIGYLTAGRIVRVSVRRRRRSGGPYEQVVGAWQEATEQLARLPGMAGLTALTTDEVTERAIRSLGREATAELAGLAGRLSAAVFSPRPPDAADAAAAWLAAARLRAMAEGRIGHRQRLRDFTRPPWTVWRSARRRGPLPTARIPVDEEA
ncbi:transglutaminase domain-containing protein [Actinoallomurus soli]|uniref:transglutaminase domain-containing protein n=1 Tax=Actinoallomurus soli TaxID=2952535 RepID=UPI002092FC90|nr:transglutaminase domain-containing protein [Actinoallomurus soli]MCO5971385.1 DUF3488 and transglutaminase-like domain-containing protein [Actinoallomurus soli]